MITHLCVGYHGVVGSLATVGSEKFNRLVSFKLQSSMNVHVTVKIPNMPFQLDVMVLDHCSFFISHNYGIDESIIQTSAGSILCIYWPLSAESVFMTFELFARL